MPKNARVFVTEDDPTVRKIILEELELNDHTAPLVATSLEEAKEKAELVEKEKVNVALLDGSLSRGSTGDGQIMASILKKKNPKIKIIGWSAMLQADWGDLNLDKTEQIAKIGKIVTEL